MKTLNYLLIAVCLLLIAVVFLFHREKLNQMKEALRAIDEKTDNNRSAVSMLVNQASTGTNTALEARRPIGFKSY